MSGNMFGTAGNVLMVVGLISDVINAKTAAERKIIQLKSQAETSRFNFISSRIDHKSSLLQTANQLTQQEFELRATSFGLMSGAIEYKTQALSDRFNASMSDLNARQAELEAEGLGIMGHRQTGKVTLTYGEIKENTKATQAARGIVLGEGSAGEVVASQDLMKEQDKINIETNTQFDVGRKRTEAVNFRNDADRFRMSADNAELGAKFNEQNAHATNALADATGNSASRIGELADKVDTNYVPGFVTAIPHINPGKEQLNTLFSRGSQVASSWYKG